MHRSPPFQRHTRLKGFPVITIPNTLGIFEGICRDDKRIIRHDSIKFFKKCRIADVNPTILHFLVMISEV